MIRDVRDAEPRVLEQPCGAHQPHRGEISLRRRKPRAEEAAHERARHHTQIARELPDRADDGRSEEECLEEAATIRRCVVQVLVDARHRRAFDALAALRRDEVTELAPAFWIAHVDEGVADTPVLGINTRWPRRH